MKALVTGATGLVGRRLVLEFEGAAVLGRDPTRARAKLGDVSAFSWKPQAGPPPAEAFSGIDVVFHLAGEPMAVGPRPRSARSAKAASRVRETSSRP